jgi:hypothetical protein
MHTGLKDRPFVLYNLISAQENPVPLPKFQMAPRLKILISSGAKKGTPIYSHFLSQKVPASKSPPGSPTGPYTERYPLTGHCTYLLIYLFISKALERPSMFPKSGAPMDTDAHSRALLNVSFGVPSKEAVTRGPPHWASSDRDAPFVQPHQVPGRQASLQVPLTMPCSRHCHSSELNGVWNSSLAVTWTCWTYYRERTE